MKTNTAEIISDRNVVYFDIREGILARLKPYLIDEYYEAGQELEIHPDDDSLYYVLSGQVEVSYEEQGTRIIVAIIGEKEFFGEVGFIDGTTRVRHIKASQASHILKLTRREFNRLRLEDPILFGEVVHLISLSICKRFRQVVAESRPLNGYSAALTDGRVPLFKEVKPIPDHVLTHELWRQVGEQVEKFKGTMYEIANDIQMIDEEDIFDTCYPRVKALIDEFDAYIELLSRRNVFDEEFLNYVWGYVFKEIFPYFMRSRFAQRAYFKPKGYAGDFLMMEAIYRNEPDGEGPLGLLIDRYCLDTPPARAVRERRRLLSGLIEDEVRSKLVRGTYSANDKIRIMNLACGSNRELFDFLARFDRTEVIEALCIDADKDALTYTAMEVNVFPHLAGIKLMQENVVKWAIGRSKHDFEKQDIIYSAGLTDYLDDRLFTRLVKRAWEYLKPGGILILSNFSINNPNKAWMDHILQWKLIHRSESDMKRLFQAGGFGGQVDVFHEKEGVNLFAVGRKEV
ncbi:MAG: cyclic nucleotide-binding domain-containing protein [Thermodesulfobacteria bacterium]|nr:cyclic nucleotide-binding domain-containing protein [Thermodesulfobacteriota bacterium]